MMLLGTAVKEFKRHFFMNLITLIELAVSIVLVSVMVTAVMIRYKYYAPFKDMYNSKGIYSEFIYAAQGFATPDQRLLCDEELFEFLSSPEFIVCSNEVKTFPIIDGETVSAKCYSYNDELINRYQPKLANGEWFDTSSGEVQAIVSKNEFGWKTGDTIEIMGDDEGLIQVKIIGEVKEDVEKLPGIQHNPDNSNDFNMFFTVYDYENEEMPLLLFSSSQLTRNGCKSQSCRAALIKYPGSISEGELDIDRKQLTELGGIYSADLGYMNENSIDYFLLQISNYLPLILVVLIMTFVSSISITALSTRQRLRDYAIYYICGSKWRSCALVNLIYALIVSAFAGIGALVFYRLLPKIPSSAFANLSMTIASDIWITISVAVLIGIYILVSMIMPLIIIGKHTPKEILTGGNNK